MMRRRVSALLMVACLAAICAADEPPPRPSPLNVAAEQKRFKQFVESNCIECHDTTTKTAGLALDDLIAVDIGRNQEAWEHVVRKLVARQMPPRDSERPEEKEYDAAIAWLTAVLDSAAAKHPNPGRTETFRRLNRTEYQNAVRDLLAVDFDVASLLPPDESSNGFDNITVSDLSPAQMNGYLTAAQKISRLAIGRSPRKPAEEIFRVRPDITQDAHIEGLPVGTRGGTLIAHNFPQNGEYEVQVRLMRDRNEEVESLHETHELEVLLDRERVQLLTVKPPEKGAGHQSVDANLTARITTTAGPHNVGVTFLAKSDSLQETMRQPLNVHFNFYRHPRIGPAVYQVSIIGPLEANGPGDTPSRRRIFIGRPAGPDDEEACAKRILANLVRRAYRKPLEEQDLKKPLELYRAGRAEGDFDAGIETALSSVLVNPQFVFHIERDRSNVSPHTAYTIDDVELASRLSFFLWSSIPDDELLDLAASGELGRPKVLEQQVRRMLADRRSEALVTNFAEQWLYLRNLESVTPDMRLFPDFDDNLRQAMRQETELFFESILREDRSVLDFIKADYTYLNERLAKHYGIRHVYGSHFRRVSLDESSHRGGLLRQGSILAVTSYATRTSPVIRGQWVLKNLVGAPPPPPPASVPPLKDNTVSSALSVRARLEQHRANEACSSCHQMIDPVGFALENFDAVGRWRETEEGKPVDASGGFLDGSEFVGTSGLEQALVHRPELFVRTLTEKLMTYALGRGLEYYDAAAVRKIVAKAPENDYHFSEVIFGIVESTPFRMRMSQ
jgi:mono/diheme cytochrome c family protein